MTVDFNKPVRMQPGNYPARIVATDVKGGTPVLALALIGEEECTFGFHENGTSGDLRLENIPETVRVVCWMNVHADGYASIYQTRADADNCAFPDRIACVRIEMDVPHGRYDE